MTDLSTQASAPRRRRFLYFLAVMNAVISVMDVMLGAPNLGIALAARAALSLSFAGAALLLGRAGSPATSLWVVRVLGVAVGLLFSVLCWATDGLAGHNGGLAAFMPLVFFIAVPDDPVALALCGASMFLAGLSWVLGPNGGPVIIWALGVGSVTAYAAVGAWFYRRQLLTMLQLEREQEASKARVAELERRAEMDDRLALLGRLLTGVAHELRNPLAWVTMNVTLLKGADSLRPPEVKQTLGEVESGLECIRQIIEDLRGLARQEASEVQPCDAGALLDEALRMAGGRVRQVARVDRESRRCRGWTATRAGCARSSST